MYSRTSSKLAVSFFIVTLFFWGCKDTPMEPVYSESEPWSDLADEQKNEKILNEARKWVSEDPNTLKTGGQCKTWIQIDVVLTVSGLYLPGNFIQAGHPYNKAKWVENNPERSDNVKVVWQSAKPDSALDFLKTHPDTIKPGHIIQMRREGGNTAVDSKGLHTALIESVNSESMTWIDSNWYEKGAPRKGFSPCHLLG